MDVAEIPQGNCVCADAKWVVVGISVHQVSSAPLPDLKPQPSSDCMGGKLALAAVNCWAVLLEGDPLYDQYMDT